MIVVTGELAVDPVRRAELLAARGLPNALKTRQEPGCLELHVFADPHDAGVIRFFERWDDDAALQAHFRILEAERERGETNPNLNGIIRDAKMYRYEVASHGPFEPPPHE
jgi:quinol monooxygenase YgiN